MGNTKKVIYYFTGTGNSLRAAERIADKLGDTYIVSMRCNPDEVPSTDADVIGFIYPVYHWTMPETAQNFIKNLKINPKAYIFVVAMPSFIVGHACEELEKLLKDKGAKIAYGNKVYGVANYVIVYPPILFPKLTVPKTEHKLSKIAEDISQNKKRSYPKTNYLIRKRFPKMKKYMDIVHDMDYGFIIKDKCISCGLCSKICPCHNITMKSGKPEFKHQCSNCMACVCYCPTGAFGFKLPNFIKEKFKHNFIVRNMRLPEKRSRYHNPYISPADMRKDIRHMM